MQAPLILALDTSTGPCTVALARGAEIVSYLRMDEFQQQSSRLMGMIEEVMNKASAQPRELQAIATTLGPGSFTSLRVGLSAAKALALSLNIPLIGLSTLEVIAYGAAQDNPTQSPILALINAHRGEVYAQRFTPGGEEMDAPLVLPVTQLADKIDVREFLIAGNARSLNEPSLLGALHANEVIHPDAQWLAALAYKIYRKGETTASNPIYIRPPDAKLPATS